MVSQKTSIVSNKYGVQTANPMMAILRDKNAPIKKVIYSPRNNPAARHCSTT
jgi:hypothetical protein